MLGGGQPLHVQNMTGTVALSAQDNSVKLSDTTVSSPESPIETSNARNENKAHAVAANWRSFDWNHYVHE